MADAVGDIVVDLDGGESFAVCGPRTLANLLVLRLVGYGGLSNDAHADFCTSTQTIVKPMKHHEKASVPPRQQTAKRILMHEIVS